MTTGQRQLISLKQWAVSQHLQEAMTPEEIGHIIGVDAGEVAGAIAEHMEHVADCAGRVA